jgi:hypothetical protein
MSAFIDYLQWYPSTSRPTTSPVPTHRKVQLPVKLSWCEPSDCCCSSCPVRAFTLPACGEERGSPQARTGRGLRPPRHHLRNRAHILRYGPAMEMKHAWRMFLLKMGIPQS